MSGGGTSGSVSLALDLHELSALGAEASTSDYVSIVDSTDNSTKKVLISNLPFGSGSGDITAVVAGAGLSGGATSGSATLSIPNQGSVSAGAYTNSNITVDARGIITDISNGSSGSTPNNSTITITAGTGLSGGGDFTTNQSSNETLTMNIDATVATLTGTQTLTNKIIRADDGTDSAPSLSFDADTDTGFYRPAANQIAVVAGGARQLLFKDGSVEPYLDSDVTFGTDSFRFNIGYWDVIDSKNFKVDGVQGSDGQVLTSTGSGVAWETPNVGDITGVTAGTGLSGGGNSGSVTLSVDSTVATLTGTQTLTNKTLTSPTIATPTITGTLDETGDIDISSLYGRLNFKKDSNGNVNNDAIFFINGSDQYAGAVKYFHSTNELRFDANQATQLHISDGAIFPPVDNDVDLGTSSLKFKDSFFGLVDAENFKINGGQGSDGQVLTSTGSGVAWETPASSGISWSTAVDANIVPDTDNAYDIGSATNEFRHGYFDGTVNCDGLNIAGNVVAGNSHLYIIGGGSQESRANIFLPNNETNMKIQGSSTSNTDIILDTRYTSGTGQILLKTKGQTRFSIGASGEFKIGTAAGTSGQVLTSGGSGNVPTWTTPSSSNGTVTSVSAGTGMTQSGTSTVNPTLNVIGGTGITANADDIEIDTSVVATLTGTQTLTNKTLTDPTIRLATAYSTTPALSFTGDTNTGITHNGGNGFSFIHGGSIKTTFASTGLKINSSTYKIHADGSDKLNIWGGSDGSAAVRINDNYDLPITDGSANQVIQTNGSGTLSFATISGGASDIGELSDATTYGSTNVGLGSGALDALAESGGNHPLHNTALGINAGTAITTGDNTVAIGYNALKTLTTGVESTAVGYLSLEDLTSGSYSTAVGVRSLSNFTTGWGNTGVGHDALWSENGAGTGSQNTAIGYQAMKGAVGGGVGITGSFNVGLGSHANSRIANGTANVAVGHQANNNVSSGSYNIGIGMRANQNVTTGSRNIAIGHEAMNGYDTENDNIAIGYDALGGDIAGGEFNIAIGNYTLDSLTSADRSIAIGYQAGTAVTTGGDHVMIGHTAGAAITNQATGVFIGYRAGFSSTGYSETIVGSQAGTSGTGYNTVVGHNAMTYGTGSANTFIGWDAGLGVQGNAASQNVGLGAGSLKDLTTGSYNLAAGRNAGQNITSGQKNIILSSNNGASSLTTGSYNVLIGNADVSSATVGQSLTISDGSGTIKWIEGDNSGSVNLPNSKLKINGSQGSNGQVLSSTGSGIAWADAGGGNSFQLNKWSQYDKMCITSQAPYGNRGDMTATRFITLGQAGFPFVALDGGDIQKVEVNVTQAATGDIYIAFYEDNNGLPSTLKGFATISSASTGNISTTSLSSTVTLTQGKQYWCVINGTTNYSAYVKAVNAKYRSVLQSPWTSNTGTIVMWNSNTSSPSNYTTLGTPSQTDGGSVPMVSIIMS